MSCKPVIAITVGDPAGVGPEIAKKSASDKSVQAICTPVIIGSSAGFMPAKPSRASNRAAVKFLREAVTLLKMKTADALVTGPAPKSCFGNLGGHTEYLAQMTGTKHVEMLMIAGNLKLLLLTRHIPLSSVGKHLSIKRIVEAVEFSSDYIKQNFIKSSGTPKIAVCGLNPHLSDGGLAGCEEKKIIIPTINILRKNGIDVKGPYSAENVFVTGRKNFDLIVCMYHDQGMLPLKLISPTKIVNLTIGLPFIRTSPGHGTAYDIAGYGIANPRPMIEAIKLACYLTKISNKVK